MSVGTSESLLDRNQNRIIKWDTTPILLVLAAHRRFMLFFSYILPNEILIMSDEFIVLHPLLLTIYKNTCCVQAFYLTI